MAHPEPSLIGDSGLLVLKAYDGLTSDSVLLNRTGARVLRRKPRPLGFALLSKSFGLHGWVHLFTPKITPRYESLKSSDSTSRDAEWSSAWIQSCSRSTKSLPQGKWNKTLVVIAPIPIPLG